MVKQNNKRYQERKTTIFVAIGYEEIYDDFNTVNPLELLEEVPSAAILKFIAEKYASVFYAQSDAAGQRQHIRDFCPHLPEKIRRKVWNFINRTEKNGNYVFIYGAMGCQMVYRLALQRYIPKRRMMILTCARTNMNQSSRHYYIVTLCGQISN